MIRVTVEMLPHGGEENKRTLAVLEIENDGTGTESIGNYIGSLQAEYTAPNKPRRGRVTDFHRLDQSVWTLVGAFLKLFGHANHSPSKMRKL